MAANYVVLARWTDQGVRTVRETVQRAQQFRMDCERRGIKVHDFVWTQGRYDTVFSLEAPDELTMMAAMLALGNLGNARTETLRAFTENEMEEALRKM
jgi:uncharacterized protein with GYD domain